jgi:hypothetical protein
MASFNKWFSEEVLPARASRRSLQSEGPGQAPGQVKQTVSQAQTVVDLQPVSEERHAVELQPAVGEGVNHKTPVAEGAAMEPPTKRPRHQQHQHHDYDIKLQIEFLELNRKVGTRDAVRFYSSTRGVPDRTLYGWAERGFEGLRPPVAGMQRMPGAGRPPAYLPERSRLVVEQLNRFAAAVQSHIGPQQVKAAFAEHARSHSWDGKRFMYSTSWARGWLDDHAKELHQGGVLTSKAVAVSTPQTRASLSAFLSTIYEWRLQFALRHGGQTAVGLDLVLTASRMLHLDEVGLYLDERTMFTVLLCTSASGHVHLIMVIFDGVRQPKDPLVEVDPVLFVVIYNDTHWNNSVAYRVYLDLLMQSLIPCRCGSPDCLCFLLVRDRFPGHEGPEIQHIFEENRVKDVVVEDTTRGAPNDFCFNKLIRAGFDARKLQVVQERAVVSAARKRRGEAALPDLSLEEMRQLALFHLRHVVYDEHRVVRLSLRHSIQHFWKHTGLSLALDSSDVHEFGTKLPDGSGFDPPLPDLSSYVPTAESLPLTAAERPESGLLAVQAKRAVRSAVLSGKMTAEEALTTTTRRCREPAFDASAVAAVLQHTSLPLPGLPLPAVTQELERMPQPSERTTPPAQDIIAAATTEQKDDGMRDDVHEQRVPDAVCARIRAGDVCYICLNETSRQDMACDRPVRGCRLTFHKSCYSERWSESSCNKCPCHDCLICLQTQWRRKCVGECEKCGADMHFECAKNRNFYCALCFSPVWAR